ncbi:MAG: hypothetical protein NC898_05840 [Candidatus Omnitrophica bacterium]|nr:hypothetical protein [Candidatus Omnitrophota bacterium]
MLVSKKNFFLILSLAVLGLKDARTEEVNLQRNPFESWFHIQEREERKREEKEFAQVPEEKPKKIELELKGILSGKRNLAIINQEILGEGDVIAGKKVVRVDKKRVILQGLEDKEEIVLELSDEF